jgi:Family of unknown function (DUF5808)
VSLLDPPVVRAKLYPRYGWQSIQYRSFELHDRLANFIFATTMAAAEEPMPQPAPFSYWIIFCPIAAVGTFSLLLLGLGRTGQRPPDSAWNGSFYSNPDDPALLVPKRFGIGYTLNFGNPWSWVVLAFVLLMVAVPIIVLVASTHHFPAVSR